MALCAKHAKDNNVDISSLQEKQKSVVPSHLEKALILATLGRRSMHDVTAKVTNQAMFFEWIRFYLSFIVVLMNQEILFLAVAACSPKNKTFFEHSAVKSLANECSIDLCTLEPQLAVAKNLITQKSSQTIEVYLVLSTMQPAFPEVFTLVCAALTIPVSSANAEYCMGTNFRG